MGHDTDDNTGCRYDLDLDEVIDGVACSSELNRTRRGLAAAFDASGSDWPEGQSSFGSDWYTSIGIALSPANIAFDSKRP